MKKDSEFYKLIIDICTKKNINLKFLSFGYITQMEKNGKVKHMIGTSLELNSASSSKIASDKFATYSVLMQNQIPVIKHNMVFNPQTRSEYENKDIAKAMIWFDEYNGKVIVKANDSSEGKDVFCVTDKISLKQKIIEEFVKGKNNLSICPFYDIEFEYRTIFLDGEILYCYKKKKPTVIGDGKSILGKLIINANIEEPYSDLDLSYIPREGEEIEVSWKHNLSQGAKAITELDINIEEKVKKLAISAGNAIGIRFASVDVAQLKNGELMIMEINSSVCMSKFASQTENGYEIEKHIFEKAIDKMFEE